MEDDEELRKIRRKKLQELMKRTSETGKGAFLKQKVSIVNKPVDVNDATFTEFILNNSVVVIDCWASWCAPCRMVAPIIDEMAREYVGRIVFGKLNVDENRSVANHYQVLSIPTLLVFKKGKLIDRIVGAMPREMLEPRITHYLP